MDVGDRGGGKELWGLELLSYFIDEPFTGYQAIEFKALDFDIAKKYSNTSWFEYTLVKLLLNFEKSDSSYYLKNYKGLKPYAPKKLFLPETFIFWSVVQRRLPFPILPPGWMTWHWPPLREQKPGVDI